MNSNLPPSSRLLYSYTDIPLTREWQQRRVAVAPSRPVIPVGSPLIKSAHNQSEFVAEELEIITRQEGGSVRNDPVGGRTFPGRQGPRVGASDVSLTCLTSILQAIY